jgi:hypothetical protein
MKNVIIKLVEENLENIKKNKIDLETYWLKELVEDEFITEEDAIDEVEKIKSLFNNCNNVEDVIDVICEKDFDCKYEDSEYDYLLNNIKNLI